MKKLKYLTIFTFILGLCTVSCNDDTIRPLGTEGEDIDPPLEVDSTSVISPIDFGT